MTKDLSFILVCVICVFSCFDTASARSDVIVLTQKNFKDQVLTDATNLWFVEFYAPWCSPRFGGHCKALAPEYEKVGTALKGLVKVGKVDCTTQEQLCAQFQVQGYPTVKLFGMDKKKPMDYQGERKSGTMIKWAMNKMPSNVKRVSNGDLDSFFASSELPKVMLFTDKKQTPPMFKGLSNSFKGKASFGEVRSSDNEVVSKYAVTSFPTVILIPKEGGDHIQYDGKLKHELLFNWIAPHAGGAPDSADGQDTQGKPDEKPATKPKPPKPAKPSKPAFAPEVTDDKFEDMCVKRSGLCVLFFVDASAEADGQNRNGAIAETTRKVIEKVVDRYRNDKFSFGWVDAGEQASVMKEFEGLSDAPAVLVLRGKRRRFAAHSGDFSLESISGLLDRVIGGDAKFTALEELPAFSKSVRGARASAGSESGESAEKCSTDPSEGQCG